MKKLQGVTLMELIIVIAIVGVMAAIAAPSLAGFLNQTRLNSVVSLLSNDMQAARSEAIKQNKRIMVCAANSTQSNCIGGASGINWAVNGWLICAASGTTACDTAFSAVAIRPPVGNGISVAASSVDPVIYRPIGVAVSSQSIVLEGGAGAKSGVLSVATTGAVTYTRN
jgi:type IV fimbrial biogenesis protein FimT